MTWEASGLQGAGREWQLGYLGALQTKQEAINEIRKMLELVEHW